MAGIKDFSEPIRKEPLAKNVRANIADGMEYLDGKIGAGGSGGGTVDSEARTDIETLRTNLQSETAARADADSGLSRRIDTLGNNDNRQDARLTALENHSIDFADLKFAVIGDSICKGLTVGTASDLSPAVWGLATSNNIGTTTGKSWVNYLADVTNATVYNLSRNSTRFGAGRNYPFKDRVDWLHENNYNPDVIIMMGGVNDWGQVNAEPFADFKAAVEEIITDHLLKYFATKRIIFVAPLGSNNFDQPGAYANITNSQGYKIEAYCDAMAEICRRYGIPCIDLLSAVGFSMLSKYQNCIMQYGVMKVDNIADERVKAALKSDLGYVYDGLHPNDHGQERIAMVLIGELARLLTAVE